MTSIDLRFPRNWGFQGYSWHLVFGFVLLVYVAVRSMLTRVDPSAVAGIEAVWLLVVISGMVFLGIVFGCWWLLNRFLVAMGLPEIRFMVLQFKGLMVWQQLGFYLCLFGLLVLAAVGCLIAVC